MGNVARRLGDLDRYPPRVLPMEILNLVRLTTISLLLASTAGCFNGVDERIKIALPVLAAPVLDADALLSERFGASERIVLRSFDGRWVGNDCDIDFLLFADRTATLTIYGNAVTRYDGNYKIGLGDAMKSATVNFKFPGYAQEYPLNALPQFQFYIDGLEILLVPSEGMDGYIRVDEPIEYPRNFEGWNWTFRQVDRPASDK